MTFRTQFLCFRLRIIIISWLPLFLAAHLGAQQSVAPPSPPSTVNNNAEFMAAADEVLQQMSEITGWKLKSPLKRSIRSRDEIHAYVLRQMDDEKDAKERYASTRSAQAFGLIPKGFDLETFLVDLLTEQVAGLYDPKTHEFYIADWIEPNEQRMVMSHELTHALEDQQFQIEEWVKAARPNDDAEMAREAVLEGSAMAAMLEYMLQEKGLKLEDLPDIDPSVFVGDLTETPLMKRAPPFIKDSLIFPYFSGLTFSMMILKSDGWHGFYSVFDKPPANTQQIMHPELYRANSVPKPLKPGLPENFLDANWTLLEENSIGVPHTRPPRVSLAVAQGGLQRTLAHLGLVLIHYEGPSSVHTALLQACRGRRIPAASFWGHVPAYAQLAWNPRVTLALLETVLGLLHLDLDLRELREQADRVHQLLDRLVESDSDLQQQVDNFEQQYDKEAPSEGLPNADAIVSEVEEFLRGSREDDEPGD